MAAPDEAQLAAGREIAARSLGADPAQDGRWQTLARFAPDAGEMVGGRRFFRLQVDGTAGDDANLYEVTLSLREHRNLPPEGLEIVSFAPTVRVPDEDLVTELRFVVPEDAEQLTIRNFDAANADITLSTAFRSAPLAASGQDEWQDAAGGDRGRGTRRAGRRGVRRRRRDAERCDVRDPRSGRARAADPAAGHERGGRTPARCHRPTSSRWPTASRSRSTPRARPTRMARL